MKLLSNTTFSWVLIAFKREFPFGDVLRLWEVLWTDYYSNDFVLFVALAVLESHRDMILRYLVEVCHFICYDFVNVSHSLQFDEVLKVCKYHPSRRIQLIDVTIQYCNELSMTIELDTTLAQAEVLFLSFAQLVADIDRRRAEGSLSTSNVIRRRGTTPLPTDTRSSNINMPTLSQNLRELLKADRS
jgi:hypothetical protein